MNRSDGKPKVYNKSHKTKWKIGMTLMNILDRKPLDKIRVQEICDSADIHRSTFYKHFGSVFDVVSFMTEEITGELTAQMDHADRRQDYMDSLVNFYVKYGRALRNLFQWALLNRHVEVLFDAAKHIPALGIQEIAPFSDILQFVREHPAAEEAEKVPIFGGGQK